MFHGWRGWGLSDIWGLSPLNSGWRRLCTRWASNSEITLVLISTHICADAWRDTKTGRGQAVVIRLANVSISCTRARNDIRLSLLNEAHSHAAAEAVGTENAQDSNRR